MVTIEFVVGADVPARLDRATGVVFVDYIQWMGMTKEHRRAVLENFRDLDTSHQRWLKEKTEREASMTANERRLSDDLEDMEHRLYDEPSDDDVDYKAAFDECEAELKQEVEAVKELGAEVAQWRNFVRRLERTWYEVYSLQSFGENSAPIIKQMLELLNSVDGCDTPVTTDNARMSLQLSETCPLCGNPETCTECVPVPDEGRSMHEMDVPDSDEDFDWNMGLTPAQFEAQRAAYEIIMGRKVDLPVRERPASDTAGLPEVKDHIIRAWSELSQQVVYWQEKWAWGPDRKTARKFTRMKALELANATNAMDDSKDIINICAIKEIY